MDMPTDDELIACKALLLTMHNTGSYAGTDGGEPMISDFLRMMNPAVDDGYVMEKCRAWRMSPSAFVMSLDKDRLASFVAWSRERYGAECARRLGIGEKNWLGVEEKPHAG